MTNGKGMIMMIIIIMMINFATYKTRFASLQSKITYLPSIGISVSLNASFLKNPWSTYKANESSQYQGRNVLKHQNKRERGAMK